MKYPADTAIAKAARLALPAYGACYRCGLPWKITEGHSTPYRPGSGCFPLCESCWSLLTVDERLPFYEQLWDRWAADGGGDDPTEREDILRAVREGL